MAQLTSFLLPLALLCLVATVSAYPTFWAAQEEATAPPAANCLAHPTTREGGHKAPVADTTGALTVLDAAGQPVTAVCPGSTYSLTLTFPEARRVLLSTSEGSLAASVQQECPNRSFSSAEAGAAEVYEDTLEVPCDVNGTSVKLDVTSAAGSSAAFQQLSSTLDLSPLEDCPGSTCPGAPPAPAAAAAADNTTTDANVTTTTTTTTVTAADGTTATAVNATVTAAPARSSAAVAAPVGVAAVAAAVAFTALFAF